MKKEIKIKNKVIGGLNPILIQSMCNIKTSKVDEIVNQIKELEKAGCDIIRVSILDMEDAKALTLIKKQINIPIVADIHFDYQLAIASVEAGADKIRINPGNIGSIDNIKKVISKAKEYNIPIRIGINSGSLEKDLLEKYHGVTVDALIESMERHVKIFEDNNFTNLVLSIKTTTLEDTILVNRKLNEKFDYPLHIGLTEAGTKLTGTVKSSYCLGTLLKENIGNTIRVSLASNPVDEIFAAKEILSMLNLYTKPELIACPTCGRTQYNMFKIVEEIDKFLQDKHSNIKVAIMGCAVNGPGEASNADIGIAGGNGEALLFKKGQVIRKIKEENIIKELEDEINKMI